MSSESIENMDHPESAEQGANGNKKDQYKKSRILYIIEATLEYFISMMVTGAYLAKLTSSIGISDSLTGILTSFVSLGCGFQLIAIFLANKTPVKRWVTVLHSVNQLFFALIYVVPFLHVPKTLKIVVFVAFLLLGHVVNNIVNSPKINWFMSLVDDKKRGRFTANKEMVSLVSGMIFTFLMGEVIDRFEANGNLNGAFAVCGITIFVLMLLHSATLIFSVEKPTEKKEGESTKQLLGSLIKDKNLFKVILVSVLWTVATHISTPFYGSYQIKELGFSMTAVAALSAAYSIVRTLFSRPMGKIADKYSFANMLNICFTVALVMFSVMVFTCPKNGKVLYVIYYLLYGIALSGINSATINLIYDYVDKKNRVGALALKSTIAGFAGFFTTLAVSPLVGFIQKYDNKFFGLNVYAQQVTSVISVMVVAILLVYLNTVVRKIKSEPTEKTISNK